MKRLFFVYGLFQGTKQFQISGFAPKNVGILKVSITSSADGTTTTTKTTTRQNPLFAWQNQSPADNLLKMVEELSDDQFSPEVILKMQELEQTLISFLEQRQAEENYEPRPPGTPPPLHMLQNPDGTSQKVSLLQAEAALEKLRGRLRYEEQMLRQAEEALQQSLQEEEILRRAEEALQRSKEAAERRKIEAIRQTEAAVVSAEKARRESEEASYAWKQYQYNGTSGRWDQNQYSNSGTDAPDVSTKTSDSYEEYYDSQKYDYDEKWKERGVETPRSTIPLNFGPVPDKSCTQTPDDSQAPDGVPILYNWTQKSDGSIEGQVRSSDKYENGVTIATSPVKVGAQGGSIIETSSGSQYYLEVSASTQSNGYNGTGNVYSWSQTSPRTAKAPDGIPTIVNWKVSDEGAISGVLYGYDGAEDGDYVETSEIVDGVFESGQVVTTKSGNQYFLSPDRSEKAANIIVALQDLMEARQGSTITITKQLANKRSNDGQPRPTFSLMNIFGNLKPKQSGRVSGNTGPGGIPVLAEWNANDDGTITGVVSGSPHLNDGDVITTSPIVDGSPQQYATVKTASGSAYYLA